MFVYGWSFCYDTGNIGNNLKKLTNDYDRKVQKSRRKIWKDVL